MFRTKTDVDRHVQDIFRKLKNDDEKNLRCYNIAKLYYQVGDYELAKRYVCMYLETRDGSAAAHKLLGQTLESLGHKEAAIQQYKISLELDGGQDQLVLKVCELLPDTYIGSDVDKIKYWVERAQKICPHHHSIFQLKEKMLTMERPSDNSEDLEALIASELSARPSDVQLRVKLLKHYISRHKFDDAYKHAADVEAAHGYRNSIVWYQAVSELLAKCKEIKHSDWSFWILYVSSLERYAALSLKEQGYEGKKTIPEATQIVFNFDQSLMEFKSQDFSDNPVFTEHMLAHMWGQLHFHLACLLIRKTKREQGSWNETGRLCGPLLLTALHVRPVDSAASWAVDLKDYCKSQNLLWYKEGSYRCSQSGHILQDYARGDIKKLMDKIDKFCTGTWRERIYQRIFVSRIHQQMITTSYFSNHAPSNPSLRLCSHSELKHYDEVSEQVWPDSLHHQIWLGVVKQPQNKQNVPHPHKYSHIFPELQFSVYNLHEAAPDSLSLIDIDAFLNAAVLCSSVIIEDQQLSGFLSPDRLPTLPADLTSTLCTSAQEKWWSAAYKMYSRQETFDGDIGKMRQELQRGLEVVRCIGNHGMHPVILVHLARIFNHRAKQLKEKDKGHTDVSSLEARCELYWSTAIPLLERLQHNQTLHMTSSKLFNYQGMEMNNLELTNALEEGKLLLAQYLVRDKRYEEGIDALQALKCPEASFQQGQIYKLIADKLVSSMPRESLTSEMRSQHLIMLSKARNCLYLTLDRLRSPGMNPKHPLNSELSTHIFDIEKELKRVDPDMGRAYGELSRNECDEMSDGSYSSAHSCADQGILNTPLTTLPEMTASVNILSTPQRSTHRTPKQASTPCRPQHQDVLDLSRNRTEARPSPERLDAQIRQMIHSRDNIMQIIIEQNKTLLESNKTITEKIDELIKDMAELRKETQRQRTQTNNPNLEEDLYGLGDEDYSDLNYNAAQADPTSTIPGNMFASSHRHPYSPLVYPSATAFQGYYQGGIPFNDPNAQAIPSLYPPNVYPMPVIYPNQSKIPEINLFTSRMQSQLSDLLSPVAPQLQVPVQKVDVTKTETTIKDAPVIKAPPVNVVITTSDTVPTTAPLVQPTLSVTIPPHYRLGDTSFKKYISTLMGNTPVVPVTTGEPNAPHCYQISMPSQATVPTTVNLPPLPTTFCTTPATISTPDVSKENNTVTHLKKSPNTSSELCEPELDPLPDFEPVIPLPPKVQTITGEEDEVTLYCARAKLFRFVDKEWKERGVGNVKLLQNSEGKVRLLMRRDQVLKICANHMLRPDMELSSMPYNDRAWVWVANDFADEEVRLERLCIKFKTQEEAQSFKNHFNTAKLNLEPSPQTAFKAISKVPISSSVLDVTKPSTALTEDTEKIINQKPSESTSLPKIIPLDKPPTTVPFSLTSKPTVQKTIPTENKHSSQKTDDTSKINPFAGFSFIKTNVNKPLEITSSTSTSAKNTNISEVSDSVTVSSKLSVVKPTTTTTASYIETASTVAVSNAPNTTSIFSTQSSQSGNTFSNANIVSRSSLRRPHAPPPAVKSLTESNDPDKYKNETFISELENNDIMLFEQKARLQVCQKDSKKWQDKCSGTIKVLCSTQTGKLTLLMYDEQSLKVCYNQIVAVNTKFVLKRGNNTAVSWTIQHQDEEENKAGMYSVIFETSDQASQFYNTILNSQRKITKDQSSGNIKASESKKELEKVKQNARDHVKDDAQKPLSELFKASPDTWECNACYIRNKASDTQCIACGSPSPLKPSTDTTTLVSSEQTSFSQFSKPSGAWKCTCGITNAQSNIYCATCDSPVDPKLPSKPKANSFSVAVTSSGTMPTFSFGIPQDAARDIPSGFSFQIHKSDDVQESVKNTSSIFDYSKKSVDIGTKFVFGDAQRPNTPSNQEYKFTFGSPGKSFEFHLPVNSPVKSQTGGDNSEEEVEESDDIHFSPIIPLPDKIEVKTGEEDEKILYSHRAKLFRYDTTVKEWKERGLGDIKLLKHEHTGKLRLIMRRAQILKLCLNHFVLPDLEFTPKDEKTWLWNAADYSEGEIEYMQFACRFKTPEIAKEFKTAVDNAKKLETVITPTQTARRALSDEFKKVPSSEDIQVVYEVQVTPEERQAALDLQLPENFYAYKQKKRCPGCLGCQKPRIPLFKTAATEKILNLSNTKTISETSSSSDEITPINYATTESSTSHSLHTTTPSYTSEISTSKSTSLNLNKAATSTPLDNFQSSLKHGMSHDGMSTCFVFGPQSIQPTNSEKSLFTTTSTDSTKKLLSSEKQCNTTVDNLQICTPSNFKFQTEKANSSGFGDTTQTVFGKVPSPFGVQASSMHVFPPTSQEATVSTSFGGLSKAETNSSLIKPSAFNVTTGNISSSFVNSFSSVPSATLPNSIITSTANSPMQSISTFNTSPNTSQFVSNAQSTNLLQPTVQSSFSEFNVPTSTPVTTINTIGKSAPVFQSVVKEDDTINTSNICDYLPATEISFSMLAKGPQTAFKQDPKFSFAGAGSFVFGSKPVESNESSTRNEKQCTDEHENENDNEENDDQDHDPHFEPVVPLPDTIEVRTGEEEEEKIFCQRAKLFRYDTDTKEWKERGVGEMKILHHKRHETYRLLLRREQVYKVVCNFLLNPSVEFHTLLANDRAWAWGGMNYAEETPSVEKLAVRFKTEEIANRFKKHIDNILEILREKQKHQERDMSDVIGMEEHEIEDEEDDDDEPDDDDEDEDEDKTENEPDDIMVEKRATLFAKLNNETKWERLAIGNFIIVYDSNISRARIVINADKTSTVVSNTIIGAQSVMEVSGSDCTWTEIDYALDPPFTRTLKAVFSSIQAAMQVYKNFQKGKDFVKQAGISEQRVS